MIRKIGFTLLALIIGLSPLLVGIPVKADDGMYEYYTGGTAQIWSNGEHDIEEWQATSTYQLNSIKFKFYRIGNPGGSATAYVYLSDGTGNYTGSALGTGTVASSGITTDVGGAEYTFTLSPAVQITSGTKYITRLNVPVTSDVNTVRVWKHTSQGTQLNFKYSYTPFTTWTTVNQRFYYKNYGQGVATPPTVTTDAATSVTSTTAVLNGNLTDMGSQGFVPVNFEYGLTTSYGTSVGVHLNTEIGVFNDTVTGLSANTTYHFRARAVDGAGAYVNGDDAEFTTAAPGTLPDTTAPTVTTTTAVITSATTARMVGTLDSLGSATSATVGFNYGIAGGALGWYVDAYNSPFSETGGFSVIVGGLSNSNVYAYQATAAGEGTGTGEIKYFTTSAAVNIPSVVTGNATVTELYPSLFEVVFNGNITSLGDLPTVKAKIRYRERGAAVWGNSVYEDVTDVINSTGSFTITSMIGKPKGTQLEYQAIVYNGAAAWYGADPNYESYNQGFLVPLVLIGAEYVPVEFDINVNPVASSSITSSGAILTATLTNMPANATARVWFSYGSGTFNVPTGPRQNSAGVDVLNNGTATVPISGLIPATPYYFYATGVIGQTTKYSPEHLEFTTLTSTGQTPGVTPTPTPTPSGGGGGTSPIDWFLTAIGHYFALFLGMIATLIIAVFVGGKRVGGPVGGLACVVEFGAAWQAAWIDPTVMTFIGVAIGYIVWRMFFSAKGAV